MTELMRHSMVEQARLVARGEVSPAELVEAGIAAIERTNPQLNAVVLPLFERARESVRALAPEAPFRGVPLLLKDILAEYAGAPLTEGSRFLAGYVSPRDSELVRRYRARDHPRTCEGWPGKREKTRQEGRQTARHRQRREGSRDGRKRALGAGHRQGDWRLRLHGARDSQQPRENPLCRRPCRP